MEISRRSFLLTAGLATATGLSGCMGGSSGGGGGVVKSTNKVEIVLGEFLPRNIKVGTGETVTWTNVKSDAGSYDHTITSASDNWNKDTQIGPGEKVTHTFEKSGVYDVYCKNHGESDMSGMSMRIAVGSASIQNPLEPNE
ncbi:MAG: plastocyanin/azurin family copper-binding protein [Halobacteria archaeon]|nr:plastocyanin/azurin family copper-binding protein [Halobacteria archaeon]